MKIIFLDIDGVLNSDIYDRQRKYTDTNIDVSRLPLLKRLIDETGAKTVLSSSWRVHWEKDEDKMSPVGRELADTLLGGGIEIFDKTPVMSSRAEEISSWLSLHPEADSFVILDDNIFGWGKLSDCVVRTSKSIGRGLEENHISEAIRILGRAL